MDLLIQLNNQKPIRYEFEYLPNLEIEENIDDSLSIPVVRFVLQLKPESYKRFKKRIKSNFTYLTFIIEDSGKLVKKIEVYAHCALHDRITQVEIETLLEEINTYENE